MLSDRINRDNLLKLAQYLEALPADYDRFEMRTFWEFTMNEDLEFDIPSDQFESLESAGLVVCGTVGCAVGHGPSAGIARAKNEEWIDYSYRQFVDAGFKTNQDEKEVYEADYIWNWCFSANWARIDNTPHGAAARIRYYLDHGLPVDALQQMTGSAELRYGRAEQKDQQS